MTATKMHLCAAVLVLIAFVLILWGLGTYNWLWMTGLACAALAHGFALWVHWAPSSKKQRKEGEQEKQPQGGQQQDSAAGR